MNEQTPKFQELKNVIEKEGKVILGLIHNFYGPLRELNFIIQNPNPQEIAKYLDEGRNNPKIKNFYQTLHSYIGIVPVMMVLPPEMLGMMKFKPKVVSNLREGERHILNIAEKHTLQNDPFYFRMGQY